MKYIFECRVNLEYLELVLHLNIWSWNVFYSGIPWNNLKCILWSGRGREYIIRFVYNVDIGIYIFSLKLFSDIPLVYLINVCLECVIDIQILYFEIIFSWQPVIFWYDFWYFLKMLFFFDVCFAKWSHDLFIFGVSNI